MLTNTHYRLHCPPLRKFHATRIYSGNLQASVRTESPIAKVKATPPWPSQLKNKKATAWKRNEVKRSRNESFPASIKLSSILRRHNQSAQHRHTVGGDSTRSRPSLKEARRSKKLGLEDRENTSHLPSSSSYSRRVDGVIQPRGNVSSILQGGYYY